MHILVVEDEKKVASLIRASLQEQGWVVTMCHDGNNALQLASEQSFDALVLDIMLPGPDGLSVLRKLRANRNAVPVILLSARGDVSERVEGLEQGADDYLSKPFSVIELEARLRYEIRREFAPYIGISWNRKTGETADLVATDGKDISVTSFVAGIKLWF